MSQRSIIHILRPQQEHLPAAAPQPSSSAQSHSSPGGQSILTMIRSQPPPPPATMVDNILLPYPQHQYYRQPHQPYPSESYPSPSQFLPSQGPLPLQEQYPIPTAATPAVISPRTFKDPKAAESFLESLQKSKAQSESPIRAQIRAKSPTRPRVKSRKSTANSVLPPPPAPPPKPDILPVESSDELNHTVLARHDPLINDIELTSAHAVLYKFVPDTSAWEKLPCQGVLFVYSRRASTASNGYYYQNGTDSWEEADEHMLAILNRQSLKSFFLKLEDITDIERLDEFVMVRSPYGAVEPWEVGYEDTTAPKQPDVWGLWIYMSEDRAKVEELCRSCVSERDDDEQSRKSIEEETMQSLPNGQSNLELLFKRAVDNFANGDLRGSARGS
ncbi:hypothetical protein POJ06DRAFT_28276 [Lipomyces tetrasporus]|uniref:Uncharacterized protein n=1 Tax=Lipomyces tetrasporus TaxID=54092 RepID=A0AAD7VP32_9ASCO|nr:uncharacterized protein POJ06DRAFT_28276 [Lipomyces tetrasporus]KAJ8097267.1 hypothetical protein POJ06DRAFT_28276 [Lipomyces tetrasporus]